MGSDVMDNTPKHTKMTDITAESMGLLINCLNIGQ